MFEKCAADSALHPMNSGIINVFKHHTAVLALTKIDPRSWDKLWNPVSIALFYGGIGRGFSFNNFGIFQKAGECAGSCSTCLAKFVLRIIATRSDMMCESIVACCFICWSPLLWNWRRSVLRRWFSWWVWSSRVISPPRTLIIEAPVAGLQCWGP